MTAPSFTGLTTMGKIKSESWTKDAGLFQMPMPASNSDSQILLDIFGTSLNLNIKGTFINGMSSKTCSQFIGELYALVDGAQTAKTYESEMYGTSIIGLVTSVTWDTEAGNPNTVEYTITLTQGSV